MQKSESIGNLAVAIIKVMKAVKGIEKNMTVGNGQNSYQGVSDKDVKLKMNEAMVANGLCIMPTSVKAKTEISRWEATYQGNTSQKQSVFTEVETEYLLMHESGEWCEVGSYGQGVDTQDKGAGKATTYALKNLLLYGFMVPTGKIEDTDNTHSDTLPVPPVKKGPANAKEPIPEPFKRKYENNGAIEAALAMAKDVKDVANLYYINCDAIEASPELKAKFTEKKNAFYTGGNLDIPA